MATKTTTTTPRKPAAKKAQARKAPARKAPAKKAPAAAALDQLARQARKDATQLTPAQRQQVHAAGLAAQGLGGKVLATWIETGMGISGQVKASTAATVAQGKRKQARKGVKGIHAALFEVLSAKPLPLSEAVDAVAEVRGKATSAGTVGAYLRGGADSGSYVKGKDGSWSVGKAHPCA